MKAYKIRKQENRVNICPNAETGNINKKKGKKQTKEQLWKPRAAYQDKSMKQFGILGTSQGVKQEVLTGWP